MGREENETVLAELTPDELELIQRFRARYTKVERGKTYSEFPRYVHLDIDTPERRVIYDLPKTGKLEIMSKKQNPDKKSFGVFRDLYNRLEFGCYRGTYREHFVVWLNGEHIQLSPDKWRKFFRVLNKIGKFYGFLHPKKPLNKVKFR